MWRQILRISWFNPTTFGLTLYFGHGLCDFVSNFQLNNYAHNVIRCRVIVNNQSMVLTHKIPSTLKSKYNYTSSYDIFYLIKIQWHIEGSFSEPYYISLTITNMQLAVPPTVTGNMESVTYTSVVSVPIYHPQNTFDHQITLWCKDVLRHYCSEMWSFTC